MQRLAPAQEKMAGDRGGEWGGANSNNPCLLQGGFSGSGPAFNLEPVQDRNTCAFRDVDGLLIKKSRGGFLRRLKIASHPLHAGVRSSFVASRLLRRCKNEVVSALRLGGGDLPTWAVWLGRCPSLITVRLYSEDALTFHGGHLKHSLHWLAAVPAHRLDGTGRSHHFASRE